MEQNTKNMETNETVKDTAKVRSMRISDPVIDQFKEISKSLNMNQDSALKELMDTYELVQQRLVLSNKEDDIDRFHKYLKSLSTMFMSSLQENSDMKNLIRQEFERELQLKDSLLSEKQEELKKLGSELADMKKESEILKKENTELHDKVEAFQQTLDTKDLLISDKDKQIGNLNEVISDKKEEIVKLNSKLSRLEDSMSEIDTLKANVSELEKAIQNKQKEMESLELKHGRELLDLEHKLQTEKFKKISEYQSQYAVALQHLQISKSEEMKDNTTVSDTE